MESFYHYGLAPVAAPTAQPPHAFPPQPSTHSSLPHTNPTTNTTATAWDSRPARYAQPSATWGVGANTNVSHTSEFPRYNHENSSYNNNSNSHSTPAATATYPSPSPAATRTSAPATHGTNHSSAIHSNSQNTDFASESTRHPAASAGLESAGWKQGSNDGTAPMGNERINHSHSLPQTRGAPFSSEYHSSSSGSSYQNDANGGAGGSIAQHESWGYQWPSQTPSPQPSNAAATSSSVASHPSGAPLATRARAPEGRFADPYDARRTSESATAGSDPSSSLSRARARESKRPAGLYPSQVSLPTGSTPVGSQPSAMRRGSRGSLTSTTMPGQHTDVPFSSSAMELLSPPCANRENFIAGSLPTFNMQNGLPQEQPANVRRENSLTSPGTLINNNNQRVSSQMHFGAQTPASTTSFTNLQPSKLPMHPARPSEGKHVLNMKHIPSPGRDLPCGAPTHGMPASTTEPPLFYTDKPQPPLSYTRFAGADRGNANPKFFRMSVGSFPANAKLAKECAVPLGAVLSPLFQPLEDVEKVPVVSTRAPVRCKGCQGYLSSHAEFRKEGLLWRCPLCGAENQVSSEESTGMSTVTRLERGMTDKEELLHGSVEYDVDTFPEYAVKNSKGALVAARPLRHLFLIDISTSARKTFLADYAEVLRLTLTQMATLYPACEVSFITYASTLHFYDFKHPRMPQLIVSDVDNPFVPLPFTNLCWMQLQLDLSRILYFVDYLVKYSSDLNESGNAFGAAVQVGSIVLAGSIGGRIVACTHSAPHVGVGALVARDAAKLSGTSAEKQLFRPQTSIWTQMALDSATRFVAFDLFLFADNFSELITMGQLARITNGKQHQFSAYNSTTDKARVRCAMEEVLLEEAGYAAMLIVRCGRGVRMTGYQGHYVKVTATDMDLANVQASSSFGVSFSVDASLDAALPVCFQTALLYTTRDGHRRLRVHSYRMPVTASPVDVFASVDLEALLHGFVHQTLKDCANRDVKGAIYSNIGTLTRMLQAYRKYTPTTVSASQYTPDMVGFLPVFLVCLISSGAMSEGTAVMVDRRTQLCFELASMPLPRLLRFLYPPLYAVHDSVGGQLGEMSPWLRHNSSINTPARSSWSAFPASQMVRMSSTASIPLPNSFGNHSALSSPGQSLAADGFPQTPSLPNAQWNSTNTPLTPQWTSPFTAAVQDAGPLGPDSFPAANREAETLMMAPLSAGDVDLNTDLCVLPPTEQLTTNTVMKEGVYLLVDEQAALVYLWIGSQVTPLVLQELFVGQEWTHPQQITQEMVDAELSGMTRGAMASNSATHRRRVDSPGAKGSAMNPRGNRLQPLSQSGSFTQGDVDDDTPFSVFSMRMRRIVDALTTRRRPKYLTHEESAARVCRLIVLHEGHANEAAFFNLLMEDKYFPTFTGQEELLKHLARRNGELRQRAGLLSGAE